jgi:PAS domain S-box-containing protein
MPRHLRRLGADVERALTEVNVPSYVIDKTGTIIWVNPAAQRIVGDVRGAPFTDVVAPADRTRAREAFARKILGTSQVTDVGVEVLTPSGERTRIEVSSVPLLSGHQVVGVFGLISRPPEGPKAHQHHPHLTPRQNEVLRMLAHGQSTAQIAVALGISIETVRNHVRGILQALEVHSRVEAVSAAHEQGLLAD